MTDWASHYNCHQLRLSHSAPVTAYSRCELARMQDAEDWPMHSSGNTEGAEKMTWVRRTSKGAKGSERILKKRKSSRGEESKTRLRQPSMKRKVARAQEIVVVTTNPIQSNPIQSVPSAMRDSWKSHFTAFTSALERWLASLPQLVATN